MSTTREERLRMFRSIGKFVGQNLRPIKKRLDTIEREPAGLGTKTQVADALQVTVMQDLLERLQALEKRLAERPAVASVEVRAEQKGPRQFDLIFGSGAEQKRIPLEFPIPLDAGFWRAGMRVRAGDVVTSDGSAWIAVRGNDTRPTRENTHDWRLLVRAGRDSKDA